MADDRLAVAVCAACTAAVRLVVTVGVAEFDAGTSSSAHVTFHSARMLALRLTDAVCGACKAAVTDAVAALAARTAADNEVVVVFGVVPDACCCAAPVTSGEYAPQNDIA